MNRMQRHLAALSIAWLTVSVTTAAVRAEDDSERYVVVKTKKAITVSGDEVKKALIVIKGGKIEAIGRDVEYPSESHIIDATDLVVMPGLINPHSRIGLPFTRGSGNKSNRKLSDDYLPPDDDTYRELLEAGYTLLGLYIGGNGMPGQGLVISTHDPKADSGVKDEGLVRIAFSNPSREKKLLKSVLEAAKKELEKEKASTQPATSQPASRPRGQRRAPPKRGKPTTKPASRPTTKPTTKPATTKKTPKPPPKPKVRPELVPFVSLLKKTDGFLAHVEFSRASDVIHFAQVVKDTAFPRAYLFGGFSSSDIFNVVEHEFLGGADAMIAMRPTLHNMPLTANPFNPAREFAEAGCTIAIFPASENVLEHERVRERLAFLARSGFKPEDAIKSVTLNAAKFLGVDKEYGSLESDKWADMIFLDGEPLDPFARVQRVMVRGEIVYEREEEE